jgi:hypothetical protein
VTGNNLGVVVDKHRVGESEPLDAFGHFPNLLAAVLPRIPRVRRQPVYGDQLNRPASIIQEAVRAADAVTRCRRCTSALATLLIVKNSNFHCDVLSNFAETIPSAEDENSDR